MVEQSSIPSSTGTAPLNDASEQTQNSAAGYAFVRPSFSYLNAIYMPPGSSQLSSASPVMQSESLGSSSSLPPMSSGLSNVRLDGTQDTAASTSSPAMQSASHPALPSSSPSATYFASNNFNNMATWMPPPPTFQVPRAMPNTPVAPAPPGIASSFPSPSNSVAQASSLDSAAPPRTFMPAAPILSNPSTQHNVISMYPSPSPHAAPPGPWLQPQQISAFARPPFSPFAAVIPGPYPTPTRGTPPVSVALPDIQPPGVSPAVSAVGAPTSSSTAGGQPAIGFGLAELPPGVENNKYVGNAETKDEAPIKEQLDAWTAHRTETGTVYYYNALTGESTYEKPPGFKGESDKATVQPTPISWEKLTGTDWTLVTTNDGKRYYYNTTTQEMLKERGVAPFSKWEKELPKIVFDPRFKDIDHNTDYQTFKRRWGEDPRFQALDRKEREALLNERVLPLKRTAQEKAQAERVAAISNFKSMLHDKGDITSSSRWSKEKLKERERALRKRKEREEQEVERVRQKARRKEALESYQALLVETIKDPQRCAVEFKALLTEVISADAAAQETQDGKTAITSWSTAKQLLKNDPRYNKMPRKERESLWRRHAEEIQRKQKKVHDQEGEKPAEGKSRTSVDSGKHLSGSRRAHDRR
ncbi:UNVERIFIED_CONTAM: Pre-mRNA-processing protein 40C [Sesamum indicum]